MTAESTIEMIQAHLRGSVGRYWPGAVPESLTLRTVQERPAARLYWYELDAGGEPRRLVVKVPLPPADFAGAGHGASRPRLFTPLDAATKYRQEYAALEALDAHFRQVGDPRFRTIRPLDRIDAARAFVTEVVPGSTLKRELARASRLRPGGLPSSLGEAVERAGAWLRAYHALPMPNATARQSTAAEFVANVRRFAEHLARMTGRRRLFEDIARSAEGAASAFPDPVPLGLTHGDFAMRNVLVTPTGEVAVLDTMAQWRSPIYEDLAKFHLSLRSTRPQILTAGLAFSPHRLGALNARMLAGYFDGAPVPSIQIRLYEVLLLLDKWAFEAALGAGALSPMGRYRRAMTDLWFRREARALLEQVA